MKSNLISLTFIILSEHPEHFSLENGKYVPDKYLCNNYPLLVQTVTTAQQNNTLQIKQIEYEKDKKLTAWLLDGVISALYGSGRYMPENRNNPVAITNLLKETGLEPENLINGRPFQKLMADIDTVERMLVYQTPEAQKHHHKLKRLARRILLAKESGTGLTHEDESAAKVHRAELLFMLQSDLEKEKEVSRLYGEVIADWLKRNIGNDWNQFSSPLHALSGVSFSEEIAQSLQKTVLNSPQPEAINNN